MRLVGPARYAIESLLTETPTVTVVRIIADDLTGALDTAAPLVPLAGPIAVLWSQAAAQRRGSFALDTETRDAPPEPAHNPWWRYFAGADLAYKKLDSLLRGRTAEEIAECLLSRLFASAVIAPAFPAQQRITRGGRQYWRKTAAETWQAVECDLLGELPARGVPLRLAASAAALRDRGFFLCDAESETDLAAIVVSGRRLAPPVLWCGSAGLARALATGKEARPPSPLAPPLLMVVGSHHPVTCTQIDRVRREAADVVIDLDPTDLGALAPALSRVVAALDIWRCAALVVALPDGTGREIAAPAYRRTFARAASDLPPPGSLLVTGGATLHQLVQALGARSLLVTGELAPGIPCSTLDGGAWPGMQVVSKSGAFGAPDLLIRLAESAMA